MESTLQTMFKRRKPLTRLDHAKELFWPSMGWRRSFRYIRHRLLRITDSTHKIALGLAIGVGVSFTPILGTHFIQAGIIAYILRGNVVSAIIGTFIGNPWTFPFFWWAGFTFGAYLFKIFGLNDTHALPDNIDLQILWDMIWAHPMTLFWPWMAGGYLLCVLSIPLAYAPYYLIIDYARKSRIKAREHRLQQVILETTGHPEV